MQYKEIYSKIHDLRHRLKEQQDSFSGQEKIRHHRAEQAMILSCPTVYVCSSLVVYVAVVILVDLRALRL